MAAASRFADGDDAATRHELTQSDPLGPKTRDQYADKVEKIKTKLKEFLPSADPVTYAYVPQVKREIRETGAWGRAAVSINSTRAFMWTSD
jgi:hypothetical protein